MNYKLTKPCDLCPFRNDECRLVVSARRLAEFASGEFCCHKTGEMDYDNDEIHPTEKSQHCAGALIFLEKIGKPHQMMRISERLGMYDASKLDMTAPVFGSWQEVRKAKQS
jgi:hypothetical protein